MTDIAGAKNDYIHEGRCEKKKSYAWIYLRENDLILRMYFSSVDGQRQAQAKLVADLTANSVSSSQVESISGYLRDWESVDFDDKRRVRVLDTLVSQVSKL